MESIALIPSKGLGDLCVTLSAAYNLSKKFKVIIFHPLFQEIQHLFPFAEARARPDCTSNFNKDEFSHCLLIYENSPFFEKFHLFLKESFKDKLYTLNPVVTNKADYRFCNEYFFNCNLSFSTNLNLFIKNKFNIEIEDKKAGYQPVYKKDEKLIVMHVTASKDSKSWSYYKFKKLKIRLEKQGYKVIFATLPHEKKAIENHLYSGLKNLAELSSILAQANFLIANESGVGHLASCLHTKSIVICRNKRIQKFWGADSEGKTYPLFPSSLIPNLKGLRIRDKFWKHFIFVKNVEAKIKSLTSTN